MTSETTERHLNNWGAYMRRDSKSDCGWYSRSHFYKQIKEAAGEGSSSIEFDPEVEEEIELLNGYIKSLPIRFQKSLKYRYQFGLSARQAQDQKKINRGLHLTHLRQAEERVSGWLDGKEIYQRAV